MIDLDKTPDSALLRLPTVLELTGLPKSSWYAGVKAGRYPAPVKIGQRAVAWRAGDVKALLASFRAKDELL